MTRYSFELEREERVKVFSSETDDQNFLQRETTRLLDWYDECAKPLLERYLEPSRAAELGQDRFRLARTLTKSREELPVCFLGNSNVGKSTLINALLGGTQQVVPSGGIGPLTAQAVEVRWASQPSFEVEYHGPAELLRLAFALIQYYRADLDEAGVRLPTEVEKAFSPADLPTETPIEVDSAVSENRELRRRRAQLLITGLQDEERSPSYLIDCLREACGHDRAYGTQLDPQDAPRLADIQRRLAMAQENRPYVREGWPQDPAFRDALADHVTGYLAPMIRTIRLRWDSPLLIGGMCLVDLPGVGIARDAHRDQTKKWVREKARAIILVVDRGGITESVARILKESELLNSLIFSADEPEEDPVLVMAITKIDDLANDRYLKDKTRKKREHFAHVVDEIRERHRKETGQHLRAMWLEGGQGTPARQTVVENVLNTLEVHPVSAPEYMRLQSQDEDDRSFLANDDDSGIPALGEALLHLTTRHRNRNHQALSQSRQLFEERLFAQLNLIESQWSAASRAEEEIRELREQLEVFLPPLRKELAVRQGSYRNFLKETVPGRIRDLLGKAKVESAREIDQYLHRLSDNHWSTLRASVRRGGRYRGRAVIDLPVEFSLRFEEPIAEVWGKEILKDIRKQTRAYANDCVRLVERASEHALSLGSRIERPVVEAHLETIRSDAKRLESVGREMLKEKRDEAKAQLHEIIRRPIEALCSDFVERHLDVGGGVKTRILNLFGELADQAAEAASVPATQLLQGQFQEVEREILSAFADHQNPLDTLVDAIVSRQEKYVERRDAQKRKRALDELRIVRERFDRVPEPELSASNLYRRPGEAWTQALLADREEWGLRTLDLARPPERFWAGAAPGVPVDVGVDYDRVEPVRTAGEAFRDLAAQEPWPSISRRSIQALHANFLLAEDPQRRMDLRDVETLAHQVSLVEYVLQQPGLHRVLIADEVGLGKTVEAGLILQRLLEQRPALRVLYLAPARLISNVRREFDKLRLGFRQWTATEADARLTDTRVLASLQRSVHGDNLDKMTRTLWDVIVVDECHHLSAWSPDGGDPTRAYRLVRDLVDHQPAGGRLILMSGTPHQGHRQRFENLLSLLIGEGETTADLAGRVIYRMKDDVRDWLGNPMFPGRQVNEPFVIDIGSGYRDWLQAIHNFYKPPVLESQTRQRAAGWRCAQSMQWATSSPHAGLGYLVRQAIRGGWTLPDAALRESLEALRPYRLGDPHEPVDQLFLRIEREVRKAGDGEFDDLEEPGETAPMERAELAELLHRGVKIVRDSGDEKWEAVKKHLIDPAGDEKVVLFAQPLETVTALSRYLERVTGKPVALIVGGQEEGARQRLVDQFRRRDGMQFLVSSRAGGEGFNLQVARRLIHLDVPWNPMDLEQRVGRVHRFGSRETIIVDTVVVKDSREAHAFQVAREKLQQVADTMGGDARSEAVFSRVMSLLPQEDLQDILTNAPTAPLDAADESRLRNLVSAGFDEWKSFHHRFSQNRESLVDQNPGLLRWEDVSQFMEQHAGAVRVPGCTVARFHLAAGLSNGGVARSDEPANVIRLADGQPYACGDYGEAQVYAPDQTLVRKLGLNLKLVADTLRRLAFQDGGAALLRWPEGLPPVAALPFGVIVLRRQRLKREPSSVWVEQDVSLRLYSVIQGVATETIGAEKRLLLDGLLRASGRYGIEPEERMDLATLEAQLTEQLRRPSKEEYGAGIRYAVTPILAGMVF